MLDRVVHALVLTAFLAFPVAAQQSGADKSKGDAKKDLVPFSEFVVPNLDMDALRFAIPEDFDGQAFFVESDGKSGYLGVVIDAVPEARVKELGIEKGVGVLVRSVVANSPASRAGLKDGDVIVAVDGKAVKTPDELRSLLRAGQEGQSLRIDVVREKKPQTLTATLETQPSGPAILRRGWPGGRHPGGELFFATANRPRLGVALVELTDQLRDYFGVDEGKGVLVSSVDAGSAAAKAGIRAGDVIVSIGTTDVARVRDLIGELQKHTTGSTTLDVGIVRDRARQSVSVTIEAPEQRSDAGVGHYRT